MVKRTSNNGILFGLSSGLCFGLMALAISSGSSSNTMFEDFLLGRGLVTVLFSVGIQCLLKRRVFQIPSTRLLARSIFASVAIMLDYYAIQHLGAGVGRSMIALNPILGVVYLWLLDKGKLSVVQMFGILVGAVGLLLPLIFQAELSPYLLVGALAAVAASIAARNLKFAVSKHGDFDLLLYLGVFQTLLAMLMGASLYAFIDSISIILLAGLFGVAAQLLLISSFRLLATPIAVSLSLTSVPIGFFLEVFVLGRSYSSTESAMTILLLLGNLLLLLPNKTMSRETAQNIPVPRPGL